MITHSYLTQSSLFKKCLLPLFYGNFQPRENHWHFFTDLKQLCPLPHSLNATGFYLQCQSGSDRRPGRKLLMQLTNSLFIVINLNLTLPSQACSQTDSLLLAHLMAATLIILNKCSRTMNMTTITTTTFHDQHNCQHYLQDNSNAGTPDHRAEDEYKCGSPMAHYRYGNSRIWVTCHHRSTQIWILVLMLWVLATSTHTKVYLLILYYTFWFVEHGLLKMLKIQNIM